MTYITGAGKVIAALKGKSLKGKVQATMRVGYKAPYAVYVHENLMANHPNGGQAKFLEQPEIQYQKAMTRIIAKVLKQKKSLESALMKAGYFLLAKSQPLVPVDTGFLKGSGFVRVT